jgi:hypothetical protein
MSAEIGSTQDSDTNPRQAPSEPHRHSRLRSPLTCRMQASKVNSPRREFPPKRAARARRGSGCRHVPFIAVIIPRNGCQAERSLRAAWAPAASDRIKDSRLILHAWPPASTTAMIPGSTPATCSPACRRCSPGPARTNSWPCSPTTAGVLPNHSPPRQNPRRVRDSFLRAPPDACR